MQPYFFPYLGYWQLIAAAGKFVLLDDVQFIKGGFVNRNYCLVNGQRTRFTLELQQASQNKRINQLTIGGNRLKLLRTFELAYRKAPYFGQVFPLLESLLGTGEQHLSDFLRDTIVAINDYLGITTPVLVSSEVDPAYSGKGEERLIHVCRVLGADRYINPPGGAALYTAAHFQSEGIELTFLQPQFQSYEQFGHPFIPGLSILDVMMFNDPATIRQMLNQFELK